MPLGITVVGAWMLRLSPSWRSVVLTQTSSVAHRAAYRSQRSEAPWTPLRAARKDQACGWKTVGIRFRTTSRPASPALPLCRCTTSGPISLTIRFSRTTAPGSVLSSASARHHRTAAPASRAAYPRSPRDGQATVTFQPRSTWSRT